MAFLYILTPIGVILSLAVFLFFEKKAILANKAKEAQGLPPPSVEDFYEKFKRYDTLSNMLKFFIASYVISLILASVMYDPSYGLFQALVYIFSTTFIGSLLIFMMKIKKSILIQVFATFLYGAPHIIASALGFLTRYIFS